MTATYLAIGAVVAFVALMPLASWLAIGRVRRGPAGTKRALDRQRRDLRLKLPADRVRGRRQ